MEGMAPGGGLAAERCDELVRLLGDEVEPRELGRCVLEWVASELGDGAEVGLYVQVGSALERVASTDDELFAALPDRPFDAGWSTWAAGAARIVTTADRTRCPSSACLALAAFVGRLEGLQRRLKREDFLSRYRGVELEALYDVGLAITGTLDLDVLGEEILLRAVSLLDARRGALYALTPLGYRLMRAIGGEAASAVSPGASGTAPDVMPGACHLLATPIEVDGERRGMLVVGDKESRFGVGAFGEKDERTLALFANQAALALETARLHAEALEKERLEREMELASRIQQQILPDVLPEPDGWELVGWSKPARQVGGDYFDAIPLPSGKLLLVLGDVTGKGMPAALLVSTLHSALQLLCDRDLDLSSLLARLNTHVVESSASNKFITLFLGELDCATGHLVWASAGHNPAFVVRPDAPVEELGATGVPIGLLPKGMWSTRETQLEPGDLLCVYSDGITEAAALSDEEYGNERLVALLTANRETPLDQVRERLHDELAEFVGDQPAGDDQTVVLLRRVGGAGRC